MQNIFDTLNVSVKERKVSPSSGYVSYEMLHTNHNLSSSSYILI